MIDSSLPVFDCSKPLLTGLSKDLADPDPGRKQELDICHLTIILKESVVLHKICL